MLELLADPWYKDGTIINYISIAVAVVLGCLAIWSQFASGKFRRSRLMWNASAYMMLGAYSPGAKLLTINYGGTPVGDPRLLVLAITLEGRKDIPSEAFDRGRPLEFDAGVPLLELVEVEWPGLQNPVVTTDGTRIVIGPELIPAGKRIEVSAIVDGKPKIECPLQPIRDVTVRARPLRVSTVPDGIALILVGAWGWYMASRQHYEGTAIITLLVTSGIVLIQGVSKIRFAVEDFLDNRKDRA
jgi:hypothetical protein